MKYLLNALLAVAMLSCSGQREEKDLTNESGQSVSPLQTIPEEEQQIKDSTTTDIFAEDTAAQKVNR